MNSEKKALPLNKTKNLAESITLLPFRNNLPTALYIFWIFILISLISIFCINKIENPFQKAGKYGFPADSKEFVIDDAYSIDKLSPLLNLRNITCIQIDGDRAYVYDPEEYLKTSSFYPIGPDDQTPFYTSGEYKNGSQREIQVKKVDAYQPDQSVIANDQLASAGISQVNNLFGEERIENGHMYLFSDLGSQNEVDLAASLFTQSGFKEVKFSVSNPPLYQIFLNAVTSAQCRLVLCFGLSWIFLAASSLRISLRKLFSEKKTGRTLCTLAAAFIIQGLLSWTLLKILGFHENVCSYIVQILMYTAAGLFFLLMLNWLMTKLEESPETSRIAAVIIAGLMAVFIFSGANILAQTGLALLNTIPSEMYFILLGMWPASAIQIVLMFCLQRELYWNFPLIRKEMKLVFKIAIAICAVAFILSPSRQMIVNAAVFLVAAGLLFGLFQIVRQRQMP